MKSLLFLRKAIYLIASIHVKYVSVKRFGALHTDYEEQAFQITFYARPSYFTEFYYEHHTSLYSLDV